MFIPPIPAVFCLERREVRKNEEKIIAGAIAGAALLAYALPVFAHAVPDNPYNPPNPNCQGKNVSGHLELRRGANGNAGGGWKAVADEHHHGLTVQENHVIAKTDCGTGNFGD